MAKTDTKELVIIGAGPGGYAAAFHAADLGLKVTLIDPEVNPGGVCLYRGCIPSKALLHLTKTKDEALKASEWGLEFEKPKTDRKKIVTWKDDVVRKLTDGLGKLSDSRAIDYIQGRARFTGEHELDVSPKEGDNFSLNFEKAIIATGSSSISLPNIDIDHKHIWDSTDALELKEIPEKMLVIGGGYIGLELGSVYASLGSKVSIAEMTPGLLPGTDRDLVEVFNQKDRFEEVYVETKVEKAEVTKQGVKVSLQGKEKTQDKSFDRVLVAVGRAPNTGNLGLDILDIATTDNGFIEVNVRRQTKHKHICAIGDITGEPMLAHKASHEGRVAAEVLAGKPGAGYDPKAIPAIVFTNPELAWCGLTEQEAEEKNLDIKVVKFPWAASGRAAAIGEDSGFTKLLIDPQTEVILGGAAAGKNAGSLIPELVLAVEMGSTAKDLELSIHPHPSLSESIMESAELFYGSATHYRKS